MPSSDRSDPTRPRAHLPDAVRSWVEAVGGPPLAAPPRLDDLVERWWRLPPRVRQITVVVSLVLVLVLPGTATLRSPWGPPVTVAVLTGDVSWADDVRRFVSDEQRPAATVPDDALTVAEVDAVGGRARGPLPAGTVLRRAHLVTGTGAIDITPGRSAVPLRADLVAAEITPGATVDVVAAGVDGRGHVLARGARVLRATAEAVWLDVSREEAVAVAGADGVDAVRLVLLGP